LGKVAQVRAVRADGSIDVEVDGRSTAPPDGGRPVSHDGALMFARFAFPPNELGYCGSDAAGGLLERAACGVAGPGLSELARGFAGAWPYMELIAGTNGIPDPLERRVVEAYWIGNRLLERVGLGLLAESLATRFPPPLGTGDRMLAPLAVGAVPHHAFHVFAVYPWVGLLRGGRVDEPLYVLDRCRIRWGRVVSTDGDTAVVSSRPLRWTGRRLVLGAPREEPVVLGRGGYRLAANVEVGNWCALHWDWLCQPLTARQLRGLRNYTFRHLAAVNAVRYPAPARVLA
jgi:hypothetical protein